MWLLTKKCISVTSIEKWFSKHFEHYFAEFPSLLLFGTRKQNEVRRLASFRMYIRKTDNNVIKNRSSDCTCGYLFILLQIWPQLFSGHFCDLPLIRYRYDNSFNCLVWCFCFVFYYKNILFYKEVVSDPAS